MKMQRSDGHTDNEEVSSSSYINLADDIDCFN